MPVYADQEKIHQVLLNLLINAIEASPEGGEVRVVLDQEESAGNARVLIEDEGSGIAEADASKIFEPFFTTKSSGTGLGLAIARNIIEQHSGTLDIGNRAGGGVCALLLLPLASEVDQT